MPPKTLKMNILGIDGLPVIGAASFPYKGWWVSMSTIVQGGEVLVWLAGSDEGTQCKNFPTVEAAITYIEGIDKIIEQA
jgi:hypothetical protein